MQSAASRHGYPPPKLSACSSISAYERVFCRGCSVVRQLASAAGAVSLQQGKSWLMGTRWLGAV